MAFDLSDLDQEGVRGVEDYTSERITGKPIRHKAIDQGNVLNYITRVIILEYLNSDRWTRAHSAKCTSPIFTHMIPRTNISEIPMRSLFQEERSVEGIILANFVNFGHCNAPRDSNRVMQRTCEGVEEIFGRVGILERYARNLKNMNGVKCKFFE